MRTMRAAIVSAFFFISMVSAIGQIFSRSAYDIVDQDEYGKRFKSGNNDVPLLALDWFSSKQVDQFCYVSQAGAVSSRRNVINWAYQGGFSRQLDAAHLYVLTATIETLPAPPQTVPPKERWLVVRGIRNHQWFKFIYDRADVPDEVAKLYEITGAYLAWSIPEVTGHVIVHADGVGDLSAFMVAAKAPFAISTGMQQGLRVWTLNGTSQGAASPLEKGRGAGLGAAAALSPDGGTIVYTSSQLQRVNENTWTPGPVLIARDWQNKRTLWTNSIDPDGKNLVIADNCLFVVVDNAIIRLDLATGAERGTWATNDSGISFLQASRDGKTLAAGFGDNSFAIWKIDQPEPCFQFVEPSGAKNIALSADGARLAICLNDPPGGFIIRDLHSKERKEISLPAISPGIYSVLWSPDGKTIAARVGGGSSSVVLYDTVTWKPLAQWQFGHPGTMSALGFENDGTLVGLIAGDLLGVDIDSIQRPK